MAVSARRGSAEPWGPHTRPLPTDTRRVGASSGRHALTNHGALRLDVGAPDQGPSLADEHGDPWDGPAQRAGRSLPDRQRRAFERFFGLSLGHVRIHADADTRTLGGSPAARAFTIGSDIYLGRRGPAPSTVAGERLLAHELTHVAQQGAAGGSPGTATGRFADAAFEGQADRVARAFVGAGRPGAREPIARLPGLALQRDDGAGAAPPQAHTRAEIEERLARFRAYLSTTHDPADAVIRYHEWLTAHEDSPELFTIEPWDLWSQVLRRPEPVLSPREQRRQEIARLIEDRNAGIKSLEGDALAREVETLRRFIAWYDGVKDSDALLETDYGAKYGQISAEVTIAGIDADVRRRVERESQARAGADTAAAQFATFDAFLKQALALRGYSARTFPYSIPLPAQGQDILVTGDPATQAVLNDLADDLMTWAGAHLHDSAFVSARPRAVLADLMQGGYARRLAEASKQPLAHETIDRGEILPGTALAAFGETLLIGLVVIGIVGFAVGAEILTAGQATWLLVALAGSAGVQSYLGRRDEIEQRGYDVPIPSTAVTAAGDVVGVSQLVEGVSGEQLGTGRRLESVERSESLGEGGGALTLLLTGSRAYRSGQRLGQRQLLAQRGVTPAGPEGAVAEPLPEIVPAVAPEPYATPGPIEAAARSALPAELRVGFDLWMNQIRTGGRRAGHPERILSPLTPEEIARRSRVPAEAYYARVAEAQRAEGIHARAADDPLRPRLRNVERRGNVLVRYETRPPSDAEVAQGQAIARRTGEPVEVFGDTPAGRNYPGIDGVIGEPARPLSLKESLGRDNVGYVRVHAVDALANAQTHGYSHVEVQISMRDSSVSEIQAAWRAPATERGAGDVFNPGNTISKIVVTGSDGVWVIEPPLWGYARPGVRVGGREGPDDADATRPPTDAGSR